MTTAHTPTHVRRPRKSLFVFLVTAIAAGIMAVPMANAAGTGSQTSLPTTATATSLASLSSGYTAYVNAVMRERASTLASLSKAARAYVEAIMAMTPAERAATFGTGKLSVGTSSASTLASLGRTARAYVEAIMAMTPAERAATFGTKLSVGTSRESVLASLSPQSRRYVEAIIALTPGQLAAGW